MTEFKRKPITQVLVSEVIQDNLENFLHICRITGTPHAIWTKGMIIIVHPARATEKIVEREFDGSRIYELVVFVNYPNYTKTIKWKEGTFELPLRNYTNFPRFCELANWIKQQPEWKQKVEDTS
jgi:hypothetical protein